MSARLGLGGVVVALVLFAAGSAAAQHANQAANQDANGPMGQGQANINVRSDVTLAIKGLRSTTSERLAQLTEIVTDQMPELRKCYRMLIAKRPTTVGSLAIRITIEQGVTPPAFELKENGGTEPDLTSCVQRVLTHASFKKVGRPASAAITLEFDNSRAKGEREMNERREQASRIEVREAAGGGYEANWASPDGKVAFVVHSDSSRDAIDPVLSALRTHFAGFADCRRRSEKDGKSPAGELAVQLQLATGGKASGKVESSTVAHPRAVPCTEHVVKGLAFPGAPAGQHVELRITFGP